VVLERPASGSWLTQPRTKGRIVLHVATSMPRGAEANYTRTELGIRTRHSGVSRTITHVRTSKQVLATAPGCANTAGAIYCQSTIAILLPTVNIDLRLTR